MEMWLLNAENWARAEFGAVATGDQRRTQRLVRVGAAMAMRPGASLPVAMEGAAELKAAYRLFGCEELSHAGLLQAHCERTRQACQEPGCFLLLEDTTLGDCSSHPATVGLGPIGDESRRGFFLHSTLAVELRASQFQSHGAALEVRHRRELVGLFAQKLWSRTEPQPGKKTSTREGYRKRMKRPRESERWAAIFKEVERSKEAQWIYVADRESDIYEVLQNCQSKAVDFVIRACHPRALQEHKGSDLFKAVAEAPLLGTTTLKLRARAGQKARTATLELRACKVELRGPYRPGGFLKPLTLTVVEARERVPKNANSAAGKKSGKEALHWVLLTSLPASTLLEALEVVVIYRERWLIEDYHKALKTGTGMERFQLESARALERAIAIVAVLAARLLGLQLLAATDPQTPLPASCADPQILSVLEARYGQPPGGWTVTNYLRALARLGGFLGRKHDGTPGWITLWRGIRELSAILTHLDFLNRHTLKQKCG